MTTVLLDDEGAITPKFEAVLAKVFLRYASPTTLRASPPPSSATAPSPPPGPAAPESETIPEIFNNALSLAREDMARFSQETNGQPLTDSTWEEVTEFFDLASEDEGAQRLSFKGFLQLYQLQTENDEQETRNDLAAWGLNPEDLELVTTRKEASGVVEEGEKVPLSELTGLGLGGERKDKDESKDP